MTKNCANCIHFELSNEKIGKKDVGFCHKRRKTIFKKNFAKCNNCNKFIAIFL